MSTSRAAAAPTRHPPGEAQPAPGALPLPATTTTAALAMNGAGEHLVGGVSDADAVHHATPHRPRQAALESETPPTVFATSKPKTPCRLKTTRQATSQLQPNQRVQPAVAQNASGDTGRHATAPGVIKRLWEASPTPMPLTTPRRSGPVKPLRGQRPLPQLSRQANRRPPCRLKTTRQATSQLQPTQQLRPSVAKNASDDTGRHATARTQGVGDLLPLEIFHSFDRR
ncbi:hypothetical protein I41_31830 [Lacipirellula limnantheis]|uniref:Uncharacterized protein n=1 Tax=Lacipirellula limnantheis TaxID=2528024 RepID=A0A517U058_9BACT|nr:hypothetical protein I41_31830 [Lacipirellula limnantheis]